MRKLFLLLFFFIVGSLSFAQDTTTKTISLTKIDDKVYVNDVEIQGNSNHNPVLHFQTTNMASGSKISFRWKNPNGAIGLVTSPTLEGKAVSVGNDGTFSVDAPFLFSTNAVDGKWTFYEFKVADTFSIAEADNYDSLPAIEGSFSITVKFTAGDTPSPTKVTTAIPTATPVPVLDSKTGSEGLVFLTLLGGFGSGGFLTFGIAALHRRKKKL